MNSPRVGVFATDALSRDGFIRYLDRVLPAVRAAEVEQCPDVDVVVYTAEHVDDVALAALRAAVAGLSGPTVFVVESLAHTDRALFAACRPAAVLPRRAVCATALAAAITAAVGHRAALDAVLAQAQRAGVPTTTITVKESAILRLVSDGLSTAEIAFRLMYSEGTVKNVLHRLNERTGLRSRSHAVAYAFRAGVI